MFEAVFTNMLLSSLLVFNVCTKAVCFNMYISNCTVFSRNSICSQVLKGILDKIEREEKKEQKLQRKAESAEEKQKRLTATKQQQLLFKHKESLKKEIQRKRTLNERNMQVDIQVRYM